MLYVSMLVLVMINDMNYCFSISYLIRWLRLVNLSSLLGNKTGHTTPDAASQVPNGGNSHFL